MLSQEALDEFRDRWLPNMTDDGLSHLLGLLDEQSRLLVRNAWARNSGSATDAFGCLATQVARHDSRIGQMHGDEGFRWLKEVVGIDVTYNISHVIYEWDKNSRVEAELAYLLREEKQRREAGKTRAQVGSQRKPAAAPDRDRVKSRTGVLSGK